MTEEQQKPWGITPELVRLSIGIEHADDIIADIEQASFRRHILERGNMGRQFALFYLTVLTLVMGAALAYGFIVGDFWEDGGELVDNPGDCFPLRTIMRRLFLLHRLDRIGKVVRDHMAWSVAILLGGNVVSGLYAVIALLRSKGDPKVFFLATENAVVPRERKKPSSLQRGS